MTETPILHGGAKRDDSTSQRRVISRLKVNAKQRYFASFSTHGHEIAPRKPTNSHLPLNLRVHGYTRSLLVSCAYVFIHSTPAPCIVEGFRVADAFPPYSYEIRVLCILPSQRRRHWRPKPARAIDLGPRGRVASPRLTFPSGLQPERPCRTSSSAGRQKPADRVVRPVKRRYISSMIGSVSMPCRVNSLLHVRSGEYSPFDTVQARKYSNALPDPSPTASAKRDAVTITFRRHRCQFSVLCGTQISI